MKSTLTMASTLGLRIGDRISCAGEPVRIRRWVEEIKGSAALLIKTFMRPSKGFARHVRRVKAHGR